MSPVGRSVGTHDWSHSYTQLSCCLTSPCCLHLPSPTVLQDGEEYYRELAAKAPNAGFKYIFTMLADEELKHYRAIEDMHSSGETTLGKSTILHSTKTIFEQLRDDPSTDLVASKGVLDLDLHVEVEGQKLMGKH